MNAAIEQDNYALAKDLGLTLQHAKYFAHELTINKSKNDVSRISQSLFNSCVDLNPHQIDAALFALRSPLSKGVILADEVGLGKTIEAGLILCQYWAERKRKLLVVCPASLRKQWSLELQDKFNLSSLVLETKVYKEKKKQGILNPFDNESHVIIVSSNYVARMFGDIKAINWDLVVIDEAHKLRNVYRKSAKTSQSVKFALEDSKKILLTATPLQNSNLELYGLASLIDENIFGDKESFREKYSSSESDLLELRSRLKYFCHRTLRSQVLEYVSYTKRNPLTESFTPSEDEFTLYKKISDFLSRTDTLTIKASQRHLMTMMLRKLLASSSRAISNTLETLLERLIKMTDTDDDKKDKNENYEMIIEEIISNEDFGSDYLEDLENEEEIPCNMEKESQSERTLKERIEEEKKELQSFLDLAKSINVDAKSKALLRALETGFDTMSKLGAARKAVIFTESRKTQDYLKDFLENNNYQGKIVLFNGSNADPLSKKIYDQWVEKNLSSGRLTGVKDVDIKTALVEHFRDDAEIFIATEAAAEGINLQFCSLLVNYDLPWNPQRIEQRIGRCHRYGQKYDVLVINFLNKRNEADARVYELLTEKFRLFEGVFGASDEVLGLIESGLDFEKKLHQICNECRTPKEIEKSFEALRKELDKNIESRMQKTKKLLFEHFDEDVHQRLRLKLDSAREELSKVEKLFWSLSKIQLHKIADFNDNDLSFYLHKSPEKDFSKGLYNLISKSHANIQSNYLYRLSHPLGEYCIDKAKTLNTRDEHLIFDISNHPVKISLLENLKGKKGYLSLKKLIIESFGLDEKLFFISITENGEVLDNEVAEKLFRCLVKEIKPITINGEYKDNLNRVFESAKEQYLTEIYEYHQQFFKEEYERIDKWENDMLLSAEKELKDVREKLKVIGREIRAAESLEVLANLQKKESELKNKRRRLRRDIDDIEDEISEKANQMKKELESRLKQRIYTEEIFTISWELV